MTPEEVIEAAKQAGFGNYAYEAANLFDRFAALVSEKVEARANERANASWKLMCEKMVAAEREACALVALAQGRSWDPHALDPQARIAAAIRARGQKEGA